MNCKVSVLEDYKRRLHAALDELVWSYEGISSWYKNSAGRVTTTSPWRLVDYWKWTYEPDIEDYEIK